MSKSKGGRRAEKQQVENRQKRHQNIQLQNEDEILNNDQNFEDEYKPVFDQYPGGIPKDMIKDAFEITFDGEELNPRRLEELLDKADSNQDKKLDYYEFVNLMKSRGGKNIRFKKLSKPKKILRGFIGTVTPKDFENEKGEDLTSYTDRYSCCPPPLFMIGISIIELGIFIGYALYLKTEYNIPTTMVSGAPLGSPLVYNPYRRYEAWRYVTYMFIHDGIRHILSNLIFQLIIGLPLEMVHHFWRVCIVYFSGVLAGSLCTSMLDSWIFLVGASGGCYALIGAHFATIIMNWKDMTHDWMTGPIKFLLSAPVQLAFWSLYACLDTGVAIYARYFSPEKSRVAYAAHFAGLGSGLLIGIPILKNFQKRKKYRLLCLICILVYLLLVTLAICWNIFYTARYPPTDWRDCCPSPFSFRSG